MNNTKWKEIFEAFYYGNECLKDNLLIRWRMKNVDSINNGYICPWDGTWSHFGSEPRNWKDIDYLQIELTPENTDFVMEKIRAIHVPGEVRDNIVTIYGYRTDVDYIK